MKFIPILILSVILFSYCTERMDIELDKTYPRLVVEGNLTSEEAFQKVKLTRSSDFMTDQSYEPVSGAKVTIYDSISKNYFNLFENDSIKGLYQTKSHVRGIPGHTYQLKIENVDIDSNGMKETYTASSTMQPINPIDSIDIVPYIEKISKEKGWEIRLYMWDSPQKDYYVFKILKNGKLLSDTITEWEYTDDMLFDNQYINGITCYYLKEKKEDEKLQSGDVVTLEVDGINKDYFNFINDAVMNYYPSIPIFSPPRANVSTNILPKEKTFGFFAAYSVRKISVIYNDHGKPPF